ncbi:hypothetical protein V1514DRAFT_332798 [Lipomyces japonicus]|uniref:uncharacterized protein n=1 Tax=Lipomyces japonicus TaxID=56871 RepID=UPI0034CEF8E4
MSGTRAGRLAEVQPALQQNEDSNSDHQQQVNYMCHACYAHFEAVPNNEFPTLCPQCQSEFCEIVEHDDEQAEDQDGYTYDGYYDSEIEPDMEIGPENWTDPNRHQMINLFDVVTRLMAGETVTASRNGMTLELSAETHFGHDHEHHQQRQDGEEVANEQARQPAGRPFERLTRFLQQAFGGSGGVADDESRSSGGEDDVEPADEEARNARRRQRQQQRHPPTAEEVRQMYSDILSMAFTRLSGNAGDYVHSQQELDQIITDLMERTQGMNRPAPADETAIASLPSRILSESEVGGECAICKDDYAEKETVTVLPCAHLFHPPCIKHWLSISDSCPICRHPLNENNKTSVENNNSNRAPAQGVEIDFEPLD